MAQQQNYGASLWATLAMIISLSFLSGCSSLMPEPEVKVVTQVQKSVIPTVARPKAVQLTDTRVFVVTKDNYDEFVKEFTEIYGELAFVALSMKDYENLALNIADIKRYLQQQTKIIVYYENAVTEKSDGD
jgi:hypothetical protein